MNYNNRLNEIIENEKEYRVTFPQISSLFMGLFSRQNVPVY